MNPDELLYAKTHEWAHVKRTDDGTVATVGISAFAIEQLTDLVYMDLPEVGKNLLAGDSLGEVESVKAVSDIYSPVTGEVIEVNTGLPDALETLGDDPYGAGWIAKIKVTDEGPIAELMNYQAYQAQCAEEA